MVDVKASVSLAGILSKLSFWTALMGISLYGWSSDLLVMRPDEVNFKTALDGLTGELDNEFSLHDFLVDKETKIDDFEVLYDTQKPKLIVLMEGKAIELYHSWQATKPADFPFPPVIVLMTAYAEERIKDIKSAGCIKYEIQAVQVISYLRSVLEQPVNRVGVLYSSNLRVFFANQKSDCEKEKAELVGVLIDERKGLLDRVIAKELSKMVKDPTIDAIWIFNDNIILKDVLLEWAWVPKLQKFKKPVVVSLERLLNPLKVGQFAVVPDHFAMGAQAARWIFQIEENGWKFDPKEELIRLPYSAHPKLDSRLIPGEVKTNRSVIQDEWTDFSIVGTK